MFSPLLSLLLNMVGLCGMAGLLLGAGLVLWQFRGYQPWSFGWHTRNSYLRQLSALAAFFFLALAASHALLADGWQWLYFVGAFNTGIWWLRFVISRRA